MYPSISDLLRDLFGWNIPLPVQTFGFFLGLSFAGAYITTIRELKRKESLGLISAKRIKEWINKKATFSDTISSVLISALIGYKLFESVLHYSDLVANPQDFILSARGSILGALIGAALSYYPIKRNDDKIGKAEPKEIEKDQHPYQIMGNVLAIAAIAGLLGAKIFHNLENLGEFMADPVGSLLSFSGLTFYGGLIVAAVAVLYYTHKNGIPNLVMCDAAAPGLMLAYGVGRIGCQLSGDGDWGINNLAPKPGWMNFLPDWTWAFRYPHNVVNDGIPMDGCVGNHCHILPYPVFPTPFYEAFICIGLFFLLWALRKNFTTPGVLFCFYLLLNGIERFFIEKIRVNTTYDIFGFHPTQAEIISTLLIIAGAVGIVYYKKRAKVIR